MLSGRQFKLERATLGVGHHEGRRTAVTIPSGSIIKVVSGPNNGDGMVDVLWDGNVLEMFEIDVNVRGTEMREGSATA